MRLIALTAVIAALAVSAADIDPCKRQPFRGRCPSKNGAAPTRSQFVLRYYLRDGECVSYPYGHCARDDSEPRLFRYKEECEDACINGPGNLGSPKETKEEEETSTDFDFDMTYGTVPPVPEQKAPIASVNASPSTTTETPITNTEVPASSTSAPRTECERRRAQSGGLVRGGFKPACTTDGSFEKMQCEPSGGQCFCVDERGIEMPNSRMHGRPDCHQILNASPMRTNECTRGSSIGPCSGSIERWFYDESQHKCFAFKYSGCGGNGNNYPNQEACMARCAPPPGTAAKCEKGEPLKTVAGIPINCEKRDCPTGYKCSVVQGSSVCCPETEKTFGALQSNTPADLCQMPKERGPCDRYELRFYYNPDARECKYFFYGGCDGNGNNFEKVEDCERRCNVTKPTRFTNGHVAQTLNPTQPAAGPVRITTTTERPTHVTETTQRPTTTHSTTPPPPPPTREPLQKVFPLRPVQVPDQQMLLESNRCQHPRDAGTCRGQFVRWFFNTEIGNCEVFTYTGCAGNGNNFASREECLLTCSRDGTRKEQTDAAAPRESEMTEESAETEVPNVANVCLHDVDAGECNGVFERFAFDHESGECRKFTYGGCGGNGNNFAALPDCEKKCGGPKVAAITNTANVPPPTVNICDHPVDKGPCTGTFGRFAFDPLTGDCQQFTYGGCAGNGNNFASLSDCRRVCLKSKTASTTEAAPVLQCPPTPRCLEGCQLVREHHGCFICNCNRPHAPAPMPPATQCPSIDINACAEPCIVFKNRRGCQECVCPLPQPTFNGNSVTVNQAVPPALPTASAQPPAPRVAQPAPPAPRAPAPPAPAPVRQPEPARTFQPQPPAPVARPVHVEPPRFEPRPPAPPAPIRVESVRTQENIHKVPLPEFEKPTDAPRRQFAQFNEQAHRENFHQIQTNSQQIPIRIEEEVRAERPQNTQTAQRLQPLQPSVVPSQITEKCMQPVEPGPCKNYVDRFYFNFEDGQCHAFKYGGCAGNRNHFFTMKECEIHCARFGRNIDQQNGITPPAPPTSDVIEKHFAQFVKRVSEILPELNRKMNTSITAPNFEDSQPMSTFITIEDAQKSAFASLIPVIPKNNTDPVIIQIPNESSEGDQVAQTKTNDKQPIDTLHLRIRPINPAIHRQIIISPITPPRQIPHILETPVVKSTKIPFVEETKMPPTTSGPQTMTHRYTAQSITESEPRRNLSEDDTPQRAESVPTYPKSPETQVLGEEPRYPSPPMVPEYYGRSSYRAVAGQRTVEKEGQRIIDAPKTLVKNRVVPLELKTSSEAIQNSPQITQSHLEDRPKNDQSQSILTTSVPDGEDTVSKRQSQETASQITDAITTLGQGISTRTISNKLHTETTVVNTLTNNRIFSHHIPAQKEPAEASESDDLSTTPKLISESRLLVSSMPSFMNFAETTSTGTTSTHDEFFEDQTYATPPRELPGQATVNTGDNSLTRDLFTGSSHEQTPTKEVPQDNKHTLQSGIDKEHVATPKSRTVMNSLHKEGERRQLAAKTEEDIRASVVAKMVDDLELLEAPDLRDSVERPTEAEESPTVKTTQATVPAATMLMLPNYSDSETARSELTPSMFTAEMVTLSGHIDERKTPTESEAKTTFDEKAYADKVKNDFRTRLLHSVQKNAGAAHTMADESTIETPRRIIIPKPSNEIRRTVVHTGSDKLTRYILGTAHPTARKNISYTTLKLDGDIPKSSSVMGSAQLEANVGTNDNETFDDAETQQEMTNEFEHFATKFRELQNRLQFSKAMSEVLPDGSENSNKQETVPPPNADENVNRMSQAVNENAEIEVVHRFLKQAKQLKERLSKTTVSRLTNDVKEHTDSELYKEHVIDSEPLVTISLPVVIPGSESKQLRELTDIDTKIPLFLQQPPVTSSLEASRRTVEDNFPQDMSLLNLTFSSTITHTDPAKAIIPFSRTHSFTNITNVTTTIPKHLNIISLSASNNPNEPKALHEHLRIVPLSESTTTIVHTLPIATTVFPSTPVPLAGFVSSPPKLAAAGVPQVAVSATPEVNNAQYVPATPPMRAAAFGKQNMEIHPISLTTLEKLATTEQLDSSTEAGIDDPHPPGTGNEKSEQVEDITPPRAVPPVTFNPPDVSITEQTEATTSEDVLTSTTSTSEMFETTVMEEVSGEEISSARTDHQQTSTSSTNAEHFDLPSTAPTLDSEESEEEEVETTDDDFEASNIETTVSANPATQNTESTMSPSTSTTLEATSSYNAPHLKEVKIQPKKLNKPEFVVVEEHTRTLTPDFTESTTISTSTLSTRAATTTVPVTTSQPTTTSENVTPVQSETTVEDTSSTATVTENAQADEDEEDLIESTESETIDITTETAPEEEGEDITDNEENEDSDSDNVRGVAGGVANVPSAPPVSNTVVVTTTVESTTTVAATTTIAAPSTTASPTTTASTTPIPVQPDAAGREPVPLAPVGIGRSMQGVNIDEIDNLEPTSHKVVKTAVPSSATQPPRNGATESAPTQRHREETFNAVIVCAMPPDAGICRNYVPRWFFNAQTGQCEQFSFGNCGGNANNFMDRATCELRCVPMHRPINVLSQVPDRCALERDQGFGRGYNVKWYFNMKNLRCEQFVYEGQGGNENQFETLTDCESYCTPRGRTHYVSLATTRQTTIQTSPATVPTTTQSTHAPTQAPTQQPKEPSIEPAPPAISDYSNEELQGETLSGEDRNVLQEIPDRVKSFEDDSHEDVLGPEPPVPDNEATLAPNPPGFEPRPPAIHSAKTENVAAPQPIPNVAADLDDKPKQSYKTEPLPAVSAPTGNENLPIVGPSPPESVNYQTGQKAKAQGILNFGDINAIDTDKFDLPDDDEEDSPVAMPACPNGLQAHRYVDGRPVQCLPGRNQCPSDSVCYFNGVDYFCCPNVEDPYDKHVFGGYDGEESKHGYKAFGPLKIQRLRDDPIRDRKKRQTAFSMDDIVMPLRFDAEKPRQFAAASVVRSSNRRRKQPNKNHVIQALSASGMDIAVCVQELAKGDCSEAHLRYFYDRDSDSCRLFYYSGCKGNGNNFGSLDDCQKTCVLGMKQMQDVGASVEVHVPAGQCPRGKLPLGGAAPVLCGNNTDSIGCPVGYYCRQGPPDVCCPGQEIPTANLDALLGARGDVRFAPQNSEEVVVTTTTIATTKKSFLEVPEFVCPDASDPLFGKNGRPLMCGAGFDGVKMCPKGFYCAIDSVKGTRLCCPLLGVGSRIPNQKVSAPYFGRRPANPGEVIERGSLPVDQANYQELPPKQDAQSETSFSEDEQIAETSAQQTAPTGTSEEIEHQSQEDVAHSQGPSKESDDTEEEASEETESETEETKADFAKLRLKPENPHVQKQQQAAEASQQVHQAESDGVSIDTNPELSVEETTTLKQTNDRSICQLTPSEGRACREDEVPPRTNLHYFFSTKDNRCKLYFYRGCGGNANRFEKKAQCEAMCLNRS